ncbi:phage tail protein, partial [Rhodococcus hoagii]|nr:phage tail protein [Prescottella equi]
NVTRAQRMGWSHYHERWQEGPTRAYTLAWCWRCAPAGGETREQHAVTLEVADGAPWKIGQNGFGHYFLGDRIGVSLQAPLTPGRIIVERVSELVLSWNRETKPAWRIQIGQRKSQDPVLAAFEQMQEFWGLLQELGVV